MTFAGLHEEVVVGWGDQATWNSYIMGGGPLAWRYPISEGEGVPSNQKREISMFDLHL